MKILVLGGSGLLGRELVCTLSPAHDVTYTYRSNPRPIAGAVGRALDLAAATAVARLVEEVAPDVVFHAAAPPSVDWHERDRGAAYAANVLGTQAVAEQTRRLGAALVYVSTTFVFPDTGATFTESDIPAPVSFYGVTKWGAEVATALNPNHVIIRTDQIYGWRSPGQKTSFVVGMLETFEQGRRAEVCSDWLNAPTYVKDLSAAMIGLVEQGRRGTYHVVGNSFLDRASWARQIAEAAGGDPSLVVPIDSASLKLPARRPNARVSNQKVQTELGMRMRTVDEGLMDMLRSRPRP